MKIFILIALGLIPSLIIAQNSIIGTWKVIDDKDGEANSHIEIEQRGDSYFGKVVKLLDVPDDVVCELCQGDKKNQPVLGLEIVTDMKKSGDSWKGGRILDPESGKTYKCRIKLIDNVLEVRGYIGIPALGRSQNWYRVE